MDSVTQAALGAAVAQAAFGHRFGRRALWWGAAAGTLPDLDLFLVPLAGSLGTWTFHRGPTHAFWFGPLVGAALGYLVWRYYARRRERGSPLRGDAASSGLPHPGDPEQRAAWIWLAVLAMTTHPLLDIFTSYGTQIFTPFADTRVALNAIGIIDPTYTLLLFAPILVRALRRRRSHVGRRLAAGVGIALSSLYVAFCWQQNVVAESLVREQLAAEGVVDAEIVSYPTVFQPFLRRIVVQRPGEVRVGYLSTWQPRPVPWRRYPVPQDPRIDALRETEAGKVLSWFADGRVLPRVIPRGRDILVEVVDLGFGLPGNDQPGLWGVRAFYGPEGRLLVAAERFRRELALPDGIFGRFWRATFAGETAGL